MATALSEISVGTIAQLIIGALLGSAILSRALPWGLQAGLLPQALEHTTKRTKCRAACVMNAASQPNAATLRCYPLHYTDP